MNVFYNLKRLARFAFSKRPLVYWWSMRQRQGSELENFGDILTPYIVEKLTGLEPILFNPKIRFANLFSHALMVGSILSQSRSNSVVWGSGIIRRDEEVAGGKFLAVRGPLTAKRLKELGFDAPDVFGDPGLLLPLLYAPKVEKKYYFGVISHYVDFDQVEREAATIPEVSHIGLLTNSVEPVIDRIAQCERIISTSLHGVITAHSYGIPALWWRCSDRLSGDDVKFEDYFLSVGLTGIKPETGSLRSVIDNGSFTVPDPQTLAQIQQGLMRTFPFKMKSA